MQEREEMNGVREAPPKGKGTNERWTVRGMCLLIPLLPNLLPFSPVPFPDPLLCTKEKKNGNSFPFPSQTHA